LRVIKHEVKNIKELAKKRLAKLFSVTVLDLDNEMSFVDDFKVEQRKTWFSNENQLDEILEDIYFVADKVARAQIEQGELTIETVGDYCCFMSAQYNIKPKRVVKLLL